MSDDLPKTRLIRIPPFYYLHVLDRNTNVTRLEIGPQTFICREHERVVFGPEKMIIVPPRHYCTILHPVMRELKPIDFSQGKKEKSDVQNDVFEIIKIIQENIGKVVLDQCGQARLRHADQEILFEQNDPFPLFPGEQLQGSMIPLQVVKTNTALRLKANRDFIDVFASFNNGKEIQRKAGDEWLFEGPATYLPQVQVDIIETINAVIVKPNQALKLKARRALVDRNRISRKAGEQWLMRVEGAYLPALNEQIVQFVDAVVLTEKKALHLKATRTFTDVFGTKRKAGEEWLVTIKDKETHIPDVYEKVIGEENLISVTNRQWCVIENPVDKNGEPQFGCKKLVRGEANFFLQPGEKLDNRGIQNVYVLGIEEALYVTAIEQFEETQKNGSKIVRLPGQRWFVYGPMEYVPSLQVKVIEQRRAWLQLESLNIYGLFWVKA